MARAKKARPKRQLFLFFRLLGGTTSGIPSRSVRLADRREGVCDHLVCEPLESLVVSLGLSLDIGRSCGMNLSIQEFGMKSREGAESAQTGYE